MIYTHTDELFCSGQEQSVVKSHCCLCHREIGRVNKPLKGNFCMECNSRTNQVSKGLLTEKESDQLLGYRSGDLQDETWLIDGVEYLKEPNGTLKII